MKEGGRAEIIIGGNVKRLFLSAAMVNLRQFHTGEFFKWSTSNNEHLSHFACQSICSCNQFSAVRANDFSRVFFSGRRKGEEKKNCGMVDIS